MRRLRTALGLAAIAGVTALLLSGCAAGSAAPTSSERAGDGFPVTITSVLGDATITKKPERIATWGGGRRTPSSLSASSPSRSPPTTTGGDDKMPPWIADAVDKLGGAKPTILDVSSNEIPLEELLKTNPDVLLAPYSGLTQKDYDAITAAGIPVVAYPTAPWATLARCHHDHRQGSRMSTQAADLLTSLDAQVKDAAAAHPEFAGVTIAYVDDDVDTFYMYLPADPRVEVLQDLGFVSPSSVTRSTRARDLLHHGQSGEPRQDRCSGHLHAG
jgi:iron complex transport system substrate-binding protein